MVPANGPIKTAADLKGHSLGIPGRYGSSWIMLQALLASANLTPDDIDIREYPDFGQGTALQQGQVDAATGFRNNEPVQLRLAGFDTTQLTIDEITPLPGPGLIVGTATLAAKHEALRAFVAATLRAMTEIIANPQVGLDDSIAQVPDLGAALAPPSWPSSRRRSRPGRVHTLFRTASARSISTPGQPRWISCASCQIRISRPR